MSQNKLAEYLLQQDKANKLKQDAIDEAVTQLVSSIKATFAAIEQVVAIKPDFKVESLAEFRKLASMSGLQSAETVKTGKRKGRKSKAGKGKTEFKLSDEKAKVILDFIGDGEKSTQEIQDGLKTKNASNALTYLTEQGKIVVAKKVGLKKFWKRA